MLDKAIIGVIEKLAREERDAMDSEFAFWNQAPIGRLVMQLAARKSPRTSIQRKGGGDGT